MVGLLVGPCHGAAARGIANVAATFPAEDVGDIRALLVEVLVTFILVFVVISVATDDRARPVWRLWPSASRWPAASSSPAPSPAVP